MTIAVTGGNGEFGRAILTSLGTAANGEPIATVRDLSRVEPLPGVEYRPGSFDAPQTLRESLHGVDTVLVNATFFGADVARRLPRVTAAIDAATEAGVERIVLTSWPDLEACAISVVQDYKTLEAHVRKAGPAWTILRLGFGLADAVARDVAWAKRDGELVAPAEGALATPAAVEDLAAAAAAVLADSHYDGRIVELTGPDVLNWNDVAALAGVPFRPVSDREYREYLDGLGLGAIAGQLIELYAAFRSGWAGTPTTALAELLGRPPVPGIDAVAARAARIAK